MRKKERKTYNNSLKLNKVTNNKGFGKTIKPFLSDKGANIKKITLVDNDKVISDNKQLCKTFKNFFQEVVKTLGFTDSSNMSNYCHSDRVINVKRKYENDSRVKKISKNISIKLTFHFCGDDTDNVEKSIGNLNSSKVGNFKNIPTNCFMQPVYCGYLESRAYLK